MFASKPLAVAINAILIATIVFNALIPTTAIAMSLSREDEIASLPLHFANVWGMTGSVARVSDSSDSQPLYQEETPTAETPTPTPIESVTETSTPELTITPTGTMEETPTETPTIENTATPSATIEVTATATGTPVPTGTPTITTSPTTLLLEFSATPDQIKAADQVTFTLKIVNTGPAPAAGLRFTNILPEGFNFLKGKNKAFRFDAQTRELTWQAEPGTTLAPGESLTLEYILLVIASQVQEDVQITDAARVSTDGLLEPLTAETSLILSKPGTSLTRVDSKGGEAKGLDGRVKLKFSEQSLETSRWVLIRDLNQGSTAPATGDPWLIFELGLRAPKTEGNTSSATVKQDSLSVTMLADASQETPTAVPTEEPTVEENDEVVPLEIVEAEFTEPVELTVSLDGIVDLATLTADINPFLVTLDEASGTWVRVPLEKIDREANLITAELAHFSTWGVGFGPSFPQNGAGVLLFDNAYPTLFTGRAKYSLPLWTARTQRDAA
jgi:uncharacterized repeat protein (TIGR01451 family)